MDHPSALPAPSAPDPDPPTINPRNSARKPQRTPRAARPRQQLETAADHQRAPATRQLPLSNFRHACTSPAWKATPVDTVTRSFSVEGGRAVSAGPRTRGAQGETKAARTGPPRPRARDKNRGKEPASRCPGERAGPHLLPGAARFHVGTPEAPATRCAAPSSNAPCTEGPHKNLGNGELPPSAHSTSPRRGMIDVDRLSPPVPQEQGAHR